MCEERVLDLASLPILKPAEDPSVYENLVKSNRRVEKRHVPHISTPSRPSGLHLGGPTTFEGLPSGPPRSVVAVEYIELVAVRLQGALGRLLVGVDVCLVDHGVRESVAGARRVSMRQCEVRDAQN